MKAPSFWYNGGALSFLSWALTPLSLLWKIGTDCRRHNVVSLRPHVPLICVGNIVAGGAGKTPIALALARWLIAHGHRPAFVTRGYGGRIKEATRVIRAVHSAKDVGDEALLLAAVAPTYVGRDRARVVALAEQVATYIIMDDGLQNPFVDPWLRLLVVDAVRGFGNGKIIPAGPLREPVDEAMQRVDAVILMQPAAEGAVHAGLMHQLGLFDVYKTRARLRPNLLANLPKDVSYYAFAGIGQPGKFFETAGACGLVLVGTRSFADHHVYSAGELRLLQEEAAVMKSQLLTTEKDWVRLPKEWQEKVKFLPVIAEVENIENVINLINLSKRRDAHHHGK